MVRIDRETLETLIDGTRRFNSRNESASYADFSEAIKEAEDALERREDQHPALREYDTVINNRQEDDGDAGAVTTTHIGPPDSRAIVHHMESELNNHPIVIGGGADRCRIESVEITSGKATVDTDDGERNLSRAEVQALSNVVVANTDLSDILRIRGDADGLQIEHKVEQ